jgi:hypothetical protein
MSGLNIIGNIQDSLNLISGEKRKFVFNSGSLDAKNDMWTADLLEIIPVPSVFNNWFLPSKDELNEMYLELHQQSVGNMDATGYPSSSEYSATQFWKQVFTDGSQAAEAKGNGMIVRPCRSFISVDIYAKRDLGPAGGLIFIVMNVGGTQPYRYYEAYPEDINVTSPIAWSNITNVAIGAWSGTEISAGLINTTSIVAQTGHTASEAKLCRDLTITI